MQKLAWLTMFLMSASGIRRRRVAKTPVKELEVFGLLCTFSKVPRRVDYNHFPFQVWDT